MKEDFMKKVNLKDGTRHSHLTKSPVVLSNCTKAFPLLLIFFYFSTKYLQKDK